MLFAHHTIAIHADVMCTCCVLTWYELNPLIHKIFRTWQEKSIQLLGSLESTNAQLSAVVAEKENLTSEIQQRKANEEGLHCLLQKKDREASELQEAYDRQCQNLRDVADFVDNVVSYPWLKAVGGAGVTCFACFTFLSRYIVVISSELCNYYARLFDSFPVMQKRNLVVINTSHPQCCSSFANEVLNFCGCS